MRMYGAMMNGNTIILPIFIHVYFLGYVKNNLSNRAIELFHQIKRPDEIVTTILFNGCAQLESQEALNLIKKISKTMPSSFRSNDQLVTSLFDALIKCGDPEYAEKLFSTMTKTVKSYGNLMNGFYENDNCIKVLDLYNQMKKISNQMKLSIYVF